MNAAEIAAGLTTAQRAFLSRAKPTLFETHMNVACRNRWDTKVALNLAAKGLVEMHLGNAVLKPLGVAVRAIHASRAVRAILKEQTP